MRWKRTLNVLVAGFMAFGLFSPSVAALNNNDINSIYNDTVWYNPTSTSCTSGVPTLTGGDNVSKTFNYLAGKNLNGLQAAAIIGNLEQESGQGLDPQADQQKGKATTPTSGDGFGIAQWTDGTRQQGLVKLAQQEGGQPDDLGVQLDYLWQELTGSYASVLKNLKSATDISSATMIFMGTSAINPSIDHDPTDLALPRNISGYENPGIPVFKNRLQNAQDALNSYGGSTGSSGASCQVSANCSPGAGVSGLSEVRQGVVCLAQSELALWQSQPNYGAEYPGFPYASTGYLKYSDNSPEEWCADFASWVYNQASYPFSGGTSGGWRIPGVSSIQSLGEQSGKFHWHPESSGYTPQPGDLAIHGGNHVNIFISNSGGASQYIGGDQGPGPYPGGSIVSIERGNGYYDNGITGYVSPD